MILCKNNESQKMTSAVISQTGSYNWVPDLKHVYELMKVLVFYHQVKDADEASEDEGVLAPVVAAISASLAAAVSTTESVPSLTVEKKAEIPAEAEAADQKVFILRVKDTASETMFFSCLV